MPTVPLIGARGTFVLPTGYAAGDSNLYRYAANRPGNLVDLDGRVADYVWDGASILIGAGSLYSSITSGDVTGTTIDTVGLVIDVAAFLVPFVPGGAGIAIKGYRLANIAADAARAAEAAKNVARLTKSTLRVADLGVQIVSTAVAYDRGDVLGTTFGAVGLGIRGFQTAPAFERLLDRLPERRGALSWGRGDFASGRGPVVPRYFQDTKVGQRLFHEAKLFRRSLPGSKKEKELINVLVAEAMVDNQRTLIKLTNTPKTAAFVGRHAEENLIQHVFELQGAGKRVRLLSVFSERIPCGDGRANCVGKLGEAFGEDLDVYYAILRGRI